MSKENIINLILNSGEQLPYGWYKFRDKFYRIFNKNIHVQSTDIRINEEKGYFIYRHETNPSLLVIVIRNYVGFISNTDIDDIKVFSDGSFICNTEDGLHKELRISDNPIIIADDIYRLANGNFVGVSNGVHYLINTDTGESKPVSETEIRFNKESNDYESYKNGTWVPIITQ